MPSKAHQAALDLYKSTVELEVELRQLLRQRQPFDKEVATARLKLRDSYEKIIFLDFEFAQSKDVEQNLWKYVYYKVIEEYRKRIRLTQPSAGKNRVPASRKLTSSFRSFLHEATGFYYSFIQKLATHFGLEQLDPVIKRFGLTTEGLGFSRTEFPENVKQKVVVSCHKSLIFLGDLARYREMQNERHRKNWSTACDYYHQARELVPDSGNPHNQLAVIATYNLDDFAAVYYYYRSLVVRHPFLTAKDNIGLLFQKAKKSVDEDVEKTPGGSIMEALNRRRLPHQRQSSISRSGTNKQKAVELSEGFFSDFILLHSLLFLKTDIDMYCDLKNYVLNQLKEHAIARSLDSEQLLQLTVINMSALFVVRHMNSENGNSVTTKMSSTYSHSSKKALVEKYACLLVLDTFATLLDVCNTELAEINEEDSGQAENATQILPAPVKRILASLRISTKWVKVCLEYLAFIAGLIAKDQNIKESHTNSAKFWERFADFLNTLERRFPHQKGIPLDVPLREDFEMHGFVALQKEIVVDGHTSYNQEEPFEEHDMRIYDIVEDAYIIAESEHSQLYFVDGLFTARKPTSPIATSAEPEIEDTGSAQEDNEILKGIDNLIDEQNPELAESQSFASSSPKALTNQEEEDDEDEVILFTGRQHNAKENGNTSAIVGAERTSPRSSASFKESPITAEALLAKVLNNGSSSNKNEKSTEKQSFWNHFNTPQLFPSGLSENQKVETSAQPSIGNLPANPVIQHSNSSSRESLKNGSNGVYDFSPFSPPTETSKVPNLSEDPLILPINRHKIGTYTAPSTHTTTGSSSASLFAFPGMDGGISQFNLYGAAPNSARNSFPAGNTVSGGNIPLSSLNGTLANQRLNPPPGLTSGPIGLGLPITTQNNNAMQHPFLPQASNPFGFSSFDVARPQLQQKSGDINSNGYSSNHFRTLSTLGTAGSNQSNVNVGSELQSNPLAWLINSNSSTGASAAQITNVSLKEKRPSSDQGQLPPLANEWASTSTG